MIDVQIFLERTIAILGNTLSHEMDPDNRRIIRRLLRQQERQLADLEHRLSAARRPTLSDARNPGDIGESVMEHRAISTDDPARVLATVLLTDIVGSTRSASVLGDQRWRRLLGEHDRLGRLMVERHRGRLVKKTGDGLLATFDGPKEAVRCALAFSSVARDLGVPLRAGLHTGEIEMRGDDVGGIAVHAAARVMAHSQPGEVLVSRVVTDLVAGAGLQFSNRGAIELNGVPGRWELFAAS